MNCKILLIGINLLLSSIASKAFTTPLDSVGVENHQGKKVILYKVDSKETYYSIAKKYQINYKDLMAYNNQEILKVNAIIKVPTNMPFLANINYKKANEPTNNNVFEYIVKKKDNLNSIAEQFNITVDELKSLNNLQNNFLQIGQTLRINASNTKKINNNQAVATISNHQTNAPQASHYVNYIVNKKDNLNVIAKNYNTTIEAIQKINNLTSDNLLIGHTLKIPTAQTNDNDPNIRQVAHKTEPTNNALNEIKPLAEKVVQKEKNEPANVKNAIIHTVAQGENIYAIAKKYGLTTYQIATINNLKSNNVSVGQKLIIPGKNIVKTLETTPVESDEDEETSTLTTQKLRLPAERYGLNQIEEKGSAYVLSDPDLDSNKMMVLHRTAPIGKIVKISNPTTGRSTFAKVIGKFTDTEETKDALIVITKAVAEAIGALDKKFFCNITYSPE